LFGRDLTSIEEIGQACGNGAPMMMKARMLFVKRVTGGCYLNIDVKREEVPRYGLVVDDVKMIIE